MYVAKVLVVLLIFSAPAFAAESVSDYIIGGQNGAAGQFVFKVSLRTLGHRHFCGGVIVNQNWFMTAAHCVVRFVAKRNFLIVSQPGGNRRGWVYRTSRIVLHPQYNAKHRQNDIALMRSALPIHSFGTQSSTRVRMPRTDTPDNNRAVLILTGLGLTRVSCSTLCIDCSK